MATEFKYAPEQFADMVKKYHVQMETSVLAFPDLPGLLNFLDIEDDEYDRMEEDEAYKKTCLWAKRRRQSYLERAAVTSRNNTGIKMLMSMPENGGYVEKAVDKTPRKMTVVLRGMFDDEDDPDNPDSNDDGADSGDDSDGDETGEQAQDIGRPKKRRANSSGSKRSKAK